MGKKIYIVKTVLAGNAGAGSSRTEKYTEFDGYEEAAWYRDRFDGIKGDVVESVVMYEAVEIR